MAVKTYSDPSYIFSVGSQDSPTPRIYAPVSTASVAMTLLLTNSLLLNGISSFDTPLVSAMLIVYLLTVKKSTLILPTGGMVAYGRLRGLVRT